MRRVLCVCGIVGLIAAGVASAASRRVSAKTASSITFGAVKVSPAEPTVDTQKLTVTVKTPVALKAGEKYVSLLEDLEHGEKGCAVEEEIKATGPKAAGKTLKLTFTPEKSVEAIGDPSIRKWCRGTGDLSVGIFAGKKDLAVTVAPKFHFA